MFHETPKSFMAQSFSADYMIKLDTTFKSHETKFHRVVWALKVTLCRRWLSFCFQYIVKIGHAPPTIFHMHCCQIQTIIMIQRSINMLEIVLNRSDVIRPRSDVIRLITTFFLLKDHMLDWQLCQICYPFEIKLLLLYLLLNQNLNPTANAFYINN